MDYAVPEGGDGDSDTDPFLQVLFKMWPLTLFDLGARMTSLSLAKEGLAPVTTDELVRWFGIVLGMGCVKLPSYKDYWRGHANTLADTLPWPNFGKIMARTRFAHIKSHLRFVDVDDKSRTNPQKKDVLWKVRPVIDCLQRTFRDAGAPSTWMAIDESMMPTHVKHMLVVTMPNKPDPVGFKVWCLSSSNGFVNGFIMSDKRETKWLANIFKEHVPCGATAAVVLRLIMALRHKIRPGSRLYTDQAFTSVPVARFLASLHIYLTGPIRKESNGFPGGMIGKKKNDIDKAAVGGKDTWSHQDTVAQTGKAAKGYTKQKLSRDNMFQATSWRDNGKTASNYAITMLATASPPGCNSFVWRNQSMGPDKKSRSLQFRATQGGTARDGGSRSAIQKVPCPKAVKDYNIGMTGVDTFDSMSTGRLGGNFFKTFRTRKWTKKALLGLFNIAITNGWIMWRDMKGLTNTGKKYKARHYNFQMGLFGAMTNYRISASACDNEASTSMRTPGRGATSLKGGHLVLSMPGVQSCYVCSHKERARARARRAHHDSSSDCGNGSSEDTDAMNEFQGFSMDAFKIGKVNPDTLASLNNMLEAVQRERRAAAQAAQHASEVKGKRRRVGRTNFFCADCKVAVHPRCQPFLRYHGGNLAVRKAKTGVVKYMKTRAYKEALKTLAVEDDPRAWPQLNTPEHYKGVRRGSHSDAAMNGGGKGARQRTLFALQTGSNSPSSPSLFSSSSSSSSSSLSSSS
jgi:hypothetical protein